jgi:predicted membrane protein
MKNKNWFWGLFFLLLAVFVIGSQIEAFGEIGAMTVIATAILAALVIPSLFNRNFFGIFFPLAFLYMIYREPLELPDISSWQLLVAALLASIGFSILFGTHRSKVVCFHKRNDYSYKSIPNKEDIDDNNPYTKVNFGSSSKYLHSDSLKTGQFIVSFGALEVYFDQAQLSPDGAEINIDCSFGAIELFVPKHWKVRDNIKATLGGVENNSRFASPSEDAPQLIINGNVQFGGVEIKYI